MQMEGVSGNKNNKIADAYEPEESPRVNESASKEPILPAPGAEKADQYTERYVLDNGTEYSTVVTRGKDHMPGVDGAKKAPEDKDKSKVIFLSHWRMSSWSIIAFCWWYHPLWLFILTVKNKNSNIIVLISGDQ